MLGNVLFRLPQASVGADIVVGAANNPFRQDYNLRFPYQLLDEDYTAGVFQLMYEFILNVTISPNANIGLAAQNPFRRDYGTLAIATRAGNIINSYPLLYTNQSIQYTDNAYHLPRQESARPRQIRLSTRPRIRISNPRIVAGDQQGLVQTTNAALSGTITGTAGASGLIGVATSPAAAIPARWVHPIGQLALEVGDADLAFTTGAPDSFYYPRSQTNNLVDTHRPGDVLLFLQPGVFGTLNVVVRKMQEVSVNAALEVPTYNPVGPFLLP